jgi:hypothetical protein
VLIIQRKPVIWRKTTSLLFLQPFISKWPILQNKVSNQKLILHVFLKNGTSLLHDVGIKTAEWQARLAAAHDNWTQTIEQHRAQHVCKIVFSRGRHCTRMAVKKLSIVYCWNRDKELYLGTVSRYFTQRQTTDSNSCITITNLLLIYWHLFYCVRYTMFHWSARTALIYSNM